MTFGVGLVSLLIALTIGEEPRLDGRGPVIELAGLSVLSIVLFLFIEVRKGREAMLDLELITKNRLFAFANMSTLLNYTAYFGIAFVLSFYMQRVLGYSLYLTGMVLLVHAPGDERPIPPLRVGLGPAWAPGCWRREAWRWWAWGCSC